MQMIRRELITDNPWNPNSFDVEGYQKLIESIRQRGVMEALKVGPDPDQEGRYILIDGYHRWMAAGELGIEELPCEVWEGLTLDEMRIRGLQLNYLRGQPVPARLANLVHDLHRTFSIDDLSKMLPWSSSQLKDSLELLKLPADLQSKLERQAAQDAAEAPVPVTVVLLGGEHEQYERAMAAAKAELGKGARKGQCLAAICSSYLETCGSAQSTTGTEGSE